MQWFFNASAGVPDPAIRLFCFPYAGGAAAAYREWGARLPSVEVLGIQLPGRGWRLREPPIADLSRLADEAAAAIGPLRDRPFVIFGHSMGAWLGFEVAQRLEASGPGPELLVVSGREAPAVGALHEPIGALSDDAFVDEMQNRYSAIPQQILDLPEVLELVLPALRADILALERHQHSESARVTCPVRAFLGDADPVIRPSHAEPWASTTSADFALEVFDGGHFYFADDPGPVTAALLRELRHLGAVGHPESSAGWPAP